ncbi:MAG TPA: peptidylprolyl isomerase [Vicinamibacterales bacterium]|nr:peptidylprolyl isomerase [Vicinamibacterales bacterium]
MSNSKWLALWFCGALLAGGCSSGPATLSDRDAADVLQSAWQQEVRVIIFGALQFRRGNVEGIRDSKPVGPKDVEHYYETNLELFSTPEQVRAQHILLKTDGKDDVTIRKLAEDLAQKAKTGTDFAALAKQYSDDDSNKARGGDLDFFGRGQMVPEFEQPAFALEPGQVSDPVKTSFGYHLIKVLEKRPALKQSLDEVRAQIEEQLRYSGPCYTALNRYPLYRAMADGGLLALFDERDLSGSFTGWGDFLALTQAGVQRTATVGLTPKGQALGSVHKVSGCDLVTFVIGGHRISAIVSNEPLEVNGERFRIVQGTHVFDIKPEFRDVLAAAGEPTFSDRRFRALLKFDAFDSRWKLQVADVGPREIDFQSQQVPAALASLRLTGGR